MSLCVVDCSMLWGSGLQLRARVIQIGNYSSITVGLILEDTEHSQVSLTPGIVGALWTLLGHALTGTSLLWEVMQYINEEMKEQ